MTTTSVIIPYNSSSRLAEKSLSANVYNVAGTYSISFLSISVTFMTDFDDFYELKCDQLTQYDLPSHANPVRIYSPIYVFHLKVS